MATDEAMQSIAEDCTPLKAKYDTCFNTWFKNSYLKGGQNHEQACGEVFAAYQQCLQVRLYHMMLYYSVSEIFIFFYRNI